MTGLNDSKQKADDCAPFHCVMGKILIVYFCGLMRVSAPGLVAHSCSSSTPESEAEGTPIIDQPELHTKLKTSLGHIGRSCLKKQNIQQKQ